MVGDGEEGEDELHRAQGIADAVEPDMDPEGVSVPPDDGIDAVQNGGIVVVGQHLVDQRGIRLDPVGGQVPGGQLPGEGLLRYPQIILQAVDGDLAVDPVAVAVAEDHAVGGIGLQKLHVPPEHRDLGHIPAGGVVEGVALLRLLEEIDPDINPEHGLIRQIDLKMAFRPVDPVRPGPLQHPQEGLPVLRIEEIQNIMAAAFQFLQGDPDHMEKLLVIADDIHDVAPKAVEGDGPQDVVQHGIGIDAAVQELPDPEGIVAMEDDAAVVHPALFRQERLKPRGGHGPVEEEALHITDIHIRKVIHQVRGFHALHDQRRRQGFGHVNHGFQDADAPELLPLIKMQELGVQLDDIHVQAAEHIQGGIAAAEIVHQDGEAVLPQLRHRGMNPVGIRHVGGLRDLHLQQLHRHGILPGQLQQHIRHVHAHKIDPGDVDGDRHRPDAIIQQLSQPPADRLPDILVQIADDPVFFQDRNEDRRRDIDAVRAAPPGQGFGADDGAGGNVDLGLEKEGDLSGFEGLVEGRQDPELFHVALMGLRVVDPDMGLEVVLDFLRRQGGAVKEIQGVVVRFVDQADAQHREEAPGGGKAVDGPAEIAEEPVDHLGIVGKEQAEVILAPVAGETAPLLGEEHQDFREADQQGIPVFLAVQLLKQLEVLNIHGDHAPGSQQGGQPLLGQGEKLLLIQDIMHEEEQVLRIIPGIPGAV